MHVCIKCRVRQHLPISGERDPLDAVALGPRRCTLSTSRDVSEHERTGRARIRHHQAVRRKGETISEHLAADRVRAERFPALAVGQVPELQQSAIAEAGSWSVRRGVKRTEQIKPR